MKVEISQKEIQALDTILNKVECPVQVGLIVGLFRVRVQEEFKKQQEKQLKEKFAPKNKNKNKEN